MTSPQDKKLRVVPFAVHATRGLLRDTRARRKTMALILVVTVAMLAAGLTVLRPLLEPHEHPGRFIFFYFACAWLTFSVLLLALLDLLVIRAEGRALRRAIRDDFAKGVSAEEPLRPNE